MAFLASTIFVFVLSLSMELFLPLATSFLASLAANLAFLSAIYDLSLESTALLIFLIVFFGITLDFFIIPVIFLAMGNEFFYLTTFLTTMETFLLLVLPRCLT